MKTIAFIALNDAYHERVTFDDIEPVELGRAYESVIEPIRNGSVATVRRGTGYTATGEISGKRAIFSLSDENVPLASIGVCLHSRASTPLWRELRAQFADELPDMLPPSAPWVAIRYDVSETAIPPWLDSLAKHVAWYLSGECQDK